MSPKQFYRAMSIAEAVTWTLLILGMVLKYGFDLGSLPVLIGGSAHGLVFLGYAGTALLVGVNQRWSTGRIATAVAMAVIPYATIPFDRRLERLGALEGEWQREAGDDPGDQHWIRRLLRWFLRRPALLVTTFIAVVAVLMTTLLLIGPPGGWS